MLETVAEVAEDWRLDDVKGLLGRCNFKSDMLDRRVSFLSGGEKVRQYKRSFALLVLDSHVLFRFTGSARLLQVYGETFNVAGS